MVTLSDVPPVLARGTPRADAPSRTHYGRVFDVSFCPWDAQLFATAGEDETARIWRDESRSPPRGAVAGCRLTACAAGTRTRWFAWRGIPR